MRPTSGQYKWNEWKARRAASLSAVPHGRSATAMESPHERSTTAMEIAHERSATAMKIPHERSATAMEIPHERRATAMETQHYRSATSMGVVTHETKTTSIQYRRSTTSMEAPTKTSASSINVVPHMLDRAYKTYQDNPRGYGNITTPRSSKFKSSSISTVRSGGGYVFTSTRCATDDNRCNKPEIIHSITMRGIKLSTRQSNLFADLNEKDGSMSPVCTVCQRLRLMSTDKKGDNIYKQEGFFHSKGLQVCEGGGRVLLGQSNPMEHSKDIVGGSRELTDPTRRAPPVHHTNAYTIEVFIPRVTNEDA